MHYLAFVNAPWTLNGISVDILDIKIKFAYPLSSGISDLVPSVNATKLVNTATRTKTRKKSRMIDVEAEVKT